VPMPDSLASLKGRLGAYALHATHDPRETTVPARRAAEARFEREVDPDGILDPAERARRAEYAKKAFFTRIALKSAKVRRENARRKRGQQ
jgi:hypothetical protein